MAEFPHQTQSPFFKSFTPRMGNVGRMWLNTQRQQREEQARQAQQAQQTVPWFGAGNTRPTKGMLGQPLSPQPWQPPPQVQAQEEAEDSPDLSTPEAMAEHIQHINQDLPDGVRYEAMDEETQAALQKIQGTQSITESPPQAPQQPPPPQMQARTPESAAGQIQQANRGLPDGVRYEPIDEETKAALQKIQAMQNAAQEEETPPVPETPTPEIAVTPTTPSSDTDLLKRLAQDEQNAFQYYQYLSQIAPNEDMQKKLQEISQSCNSRQNIFKQMLQDDFDVKEIRINDSIQFTQGMAIAIREETKILDNMARLIEQSKGDSNLQNMLNKRLIQQNWLQWALFQSQ